MAARASERRCADLTPLESSTSTRPTQEEAALGPDPADGHLRDDGGGRMFRVGDIADLGDIATRISAELRNEYVLRYRPSEVKKDWQLA